MQVWVFVLKLWGLVVTCEYFAKQKKRKKIYILFHVLDSNKRELRSQMIIEMFIANCTYYKAYAPVLSYIIIKYELKCHFNRIAIHYQLTPN